MSARTAADVTAVRMMMDRLGVTVDELTRVSPPQQVPTFAEYIPVVAASIPAGKTRDHFVDLLEQDSDAAFVDRVGWRHRNHRTARLWQEVRPEIQSSGDDAVSVSEIRPGLQAARHDGWLRTQQLRDEPTPAIWWLMPGAKPRFRPACNKDDISWAATSSMDASARFVPIQTAWKTSGQHSA